MGDAMDRFININQFVIKLPCRFDVKRFVQNHLKRIAL